jgi:hypothetical protein
MARTINHASIAKSSIRNVSKYQLIRAIFFNLNPRRWKLALQPLQEKREFMHLFN